MLSIRPYEAADLQCVVALWQACDLTRPWNDPAADIQFCIHSENSTLLVGLAAGQSKVVATAMVGHDGHRGWVYYVAVAPELQRTGAGREIMNHAEKWLANRGVPKAMLMIRETNKKVIAFYEQLGYEVEERVVMSRWLKNH
ncbi:MAG: GNAT family acetyltransferase [Candidatus Binataceae bacterium]